MSRTRFLITILICGMVAVIWHAAKVSSQSVSPSQDKSVNSSADDYVGSEVCKDCHEDQFKAFEKTSHAELSKMGSWKNKVTGCEACHGPGKAHIEEGDPAKIISYKNKSPKEISETCLGCHAGREERNNFRRGEHWRNDVGCTDCHSPHSTPAGRNVPRSITFVGPANAEKQDFSTIAMLKKGEPQLCIGCHGEVKPDFQKSFHHKVLEGIMKCSDCHNPHGGFELKQARLATGADAACIKCHADKQGPFTYETQAIDRNAADLIVAVDGERIVKAGDFLALVEAKKPGAEVVITVVRGGREVNVPVRLVAGDS